MTTPFLRRIIPDQLSALRRPPVDAGALEQARPIVEDVRARGESALREHAERLGDIRPGEPLLLDRAALRAGLDRVRAEDRALLERTGARIRAFAAAQRRCFTELSTDIPGGTAGHTIAPVQRAGCYAPGGRFPLPSSVLMTAVTARAAGVPQVIVASPRPAPITIAAAAVADADFLLTVGGAQAIAALAFGAGPVPRCDMIAGPGNKYVTAAKWLVYGGAGIDMLAGPSELVVLADAGADPALIAADLLAQAEHDDDAVPILVTTDAPLIDRVEAELAAQLVTMPTATTARRSLANGGALLVPDIDAAIRACDHLAPEHLEVMARDADAVAGRLRNYGSLFIGAASAEVFGDYGMGPNHVLPTGGTARFAGGLSVLSFLRIRTWLAIDPARPIAGFAGDTAALARLEGLEAHARAAERRER